MLRCTTGHRKSFYVITPQSEDMVIETTTVDAIAKLQTSVRHIQLQNANLNMMAGLDSASIPCASGYADLQDEVSFPLFEDLPGDNDINMRFLGTIDGFHYSPRRHWCFLGEIVSVEVVFRLRLLVKDKAGHQIPITFYTDRRGADMDEALLKKGNTVAILYATWVSGHDHGYTS